jgi:hypothetical protein
MGTFFKTFFKTFFRKKSPLEFRALPLMGQGFESYRAAQQRGNDLSRGPY